MIFLIGSLLLLTVFLIPLLGIINNLGYEQIKVFFFLISLFVTGFIWLIFSFKHRIKKAWSPINKTALVFITILFITSLLGVNRWNSFLGVWPYFQGWILYAYLFLFFLLVSWSKIKLDKWSFCLVASSLVVSFLAIKDWVLLNILGVQVPTYAGRVVSTFGQPNFYAGFLLLSLPFCYFLFKSSTKNKLSYFGMISGLISVIGIFVSYSRSAILLALILLILGLFSSLSSRRMSGSIKIKVNWIPAFAGMTLLVLTITVFLSIHFSSGFIWKEFLAPSKTSNPDLTKESVEKRAYIWPVAVKIAWQKPLLGYGLENIGPAFSDYFEDNKHSLFEANQKISPVLLSLKELNINRTHNYLLDLLLFSGILGLLGWLGLLGVLFKKFGQMSHDRGTNVLAVALVTYLVWVQFQNQSVVHLIYFWLLAGLVDSAPDGR